MTESASDKPKEPAVDVGAERVAAVYAKALLAAAEAKGKTDQAVEELNTVVASGLRPFPKFAEVLGSALISVADKEQMLDRVFGGKVSPLVLDFLKVVGRHGRLDILRAIDREVQKLYDEMRGRVRVELRTAVPIADKLSQSIAASLKQLLGGDPKLESAVDPAIIGGTVVRVGDKVYDASIARQLEQVRQSMITRSVHEIQSRRDRFRHPGGN